MSAADIERRAGRDDSRRPRRPLLRRADRAGPAGASGGADRRARSARPGARIVTDANVAQRHLAPLRGRPDGARPSRRHRGAGARRGDQELPSPGAPVRAPARDGPGARRSRRRAGRRRDRRPRRLRRQHRAARHRASCRCRPRCWRRSIPRSAARPASTRRKARTWSAPSISRAWCWPTSMRWRRCRRAQFRAGYVEAAKYGLLGDAAYLRLAGAERRRRCSPSDAAALTHALAVSVQGKADIVARDETETGDRMLLNLGHTFGHALEAWAGFSDRLLHGEAVAIGICLAFRLSEELGLIGNNSVARVEAHFAALGLPTRIADIPGGQPPDAATLVKIMGQDKKVRDGTADADPGARHRRSLHHPRCRRATRCWRSWPARCRPPEPARLRPWSLAIRACGCACRPYDGSRRQAFVGLAALLVATASRTAKPWRPMDTRNRHHPGGHRRAAGPVGLLQRQRDGADRRVAGAHARARAGRQRTAPASSTGCCSSRRR